MVEVGHPPQPRRSPLHDRHLTAGAKLVEFAGWEMPLQYEGIRAEHLAVRTSAGMFDVSHMGQIETCGPQATELLQRLVSNDIRKLPIGGAQYSVICAEDGGVLDDLITYRLAECEYLTVTNAANHPDDLAWFEAHAVGYDADVIDMVDRFAMIAVQGPAARAIVRGVADGTLPPRLHVCERSVADVGVTVCATGYTGEDGVELIVDPADAGAVWDGLVAAGATPAGLGARDTLRLEACLPLYGSELCRERGPIEAGLGWCCAEATGFIGADAIAQARTRAGADAALSEERLAAFVLDQPAGPFPRQGNPVQDGGVVTSGTVSPSLQRGIGMAYVPAQRTAPGTALTIDVRGTPRAATVHRKPLYTKEA